jgi:predicted nucleic acid-binding protein
LTNSVTNLFWDSCVLIRYLTGQNPYYDDIKQYLDDARQGSVVIHVSTIAMAEVKPSHLTGKGYGDFNDFLDDFEGAFSLIEPSPDILRWCAVVRDFDYPNPAPDKNAKARALGLGDAIHLLSCVYAKEVMGVPDIVFHTMDDGKTRNSEGKCVPLLSFEKWVAGIPKNPHTPKICALPRTLPLHPEPALITPGPSA